MGRVVGDRCLSQAQPPVVARSLPVPGSAPRRCTAPVGESRPEIWRRAERALSVGAEIEFTLTGTDYLEGYSPGHSSKNDKYMLIRAQAAYRFGTTPSSSLQK